MRVPCAATSLEMPRVQVVGADVREGTIAQLNVFKGTTGVTYPLMRNCYISPAHAECFVSFYGERGHFAVIDQAGYVRYNSTLTWPSVMAVLVRMCFAAWKPFWKTRLRTGPV